MVLLFVDEGQGNRFICHGMLDPNTTSDSVVAVNHGRDGSLLLRQSIVGWYGADLPVEPKDRLLDTFEARGWHTVPKRAR